VHLAGIEGFTPIFRKNVFRIFPGGRHSEQYYEVLPTWFVRFFEMICPTNPGNFFIVFEKRRAMKLKLYQDAGYRILELWDDELLDDFNPDVVSAKIHGFINWGR